MVFFNYSTMQMAAKVVYYGPGLCGKTTNLQHIYSHTSSRSRGEMVSLETETDRTLFFDLLPLEVGKIQGFKTRIQLYTVPGQVFYNTTRKLVLKGVDGVVFVADSQRAMEQANIESLANLEANLDEIGLTFDDVPIVLQYNKRDLANISSVEEMEAALNTRNWPSFEASALTGEGVFDTLRGISKLTLIGLKKRLNESSDATQASPGSPSAPSKPVPVQPVAEPTVDVVDTPAAAPAAERPSSTSVEPAPSLASTPATEAPAPTGVRRGGVDILAELEKIRQQARLKNAKAEADNAEPASTNITADRMDPAPAEPVLSDHQPTVDQMAANQDPSGAFDVADFKAAAASQLGDAALSTAATVANDATDPLLAPVANSDHGADSTLQSSGFDADGDFELEPIPDEGETGGDFLTPAVMPHHVSGNGRREIDHSFEFHPTAETLERASRLSFRLRIEDANQAVVDTFDEAIQVTDAESIRQLLLNLRIALDPEGVGTGLASSGSADTDE